uniref:Putative pheromone response factor n=1 Tax=Drosophila melanogaster TaxID=7227 RepID=Q8T0X9_DROME|nr:putative pheromone response factor [Drosophila melanogaster]
MKATFTILVLQVVICLAGATEYQLTLDKDGLLAPCENQPGNPSGFEAMVDTSSLKVHNLGSKVRIEGEQKVVWKDVQPGDTLKVFGQVYRLDKGTWQKTMFTASSNNFCKNMFDKNQYWYNFWTKYISNSDEIKEKCLTTPGAVLKYKDYELDLKTSLNVPNLDGRYKLVVQIEAFDKRNVRRPVPICIEFRGTSGQV